MPSFIRYLTAIIISASLVTPTVSIKRDTTNYAPWKFKNKQYEHNVLHPSLQSLRNIDLGVISSKLNMSIPATAVGLTFVTLSINKIVFKTTHLLLRKLGIKKQQKTKSEPKIPESTFQETKIPETKPPPENERPLTEDEVIQCQEQWARAIESISLAYLRGGHFVSAATDVAEKLYGYGHHDVLFKPTKASKHPFRTNAHEAMSYFVGADNLDNSEKFRGEDLGFAINGGKGWKNVVFNNHKIYIDDKIALAMGTYDFTCATTGEITSAEFTFGYKRCSDGKVRIFLHHSSVPYKGLNLPPETNKQETGHRQQLCTQVHIHVLSSDDDYSDEPHSDLKKHLKYLVK